jgi:hypothetical protein
MIIIRAVAVALAALLVAGSASASTLKIREYTKLGSSYTGGSPQIAQEPGHDMSPVTFTGTAGSSAAFASDTNFIAVVADVQFCYSVGASPTATTNMISVPATELLYIGVSPLLKISAIACP